MNIAYLDQHRPDWRTEPVAAVVAWTREATWLPEVSRVNDVAIMARLSVAESDEVFATLDAAAAGSKTVQRALRQLEGEGIDLSHANAIGLINTLFNGNPPLRDKLLAMGRRTATHWEALGMRPMDDASRQHWIEQARVQA